MQRAFYVGYRLNPMEVAMTREFDKVTGDRTAVLSEKVDEVLKGLEEVLDIPAYPRMTSQMTIPEMTIMRHYTFEDWDNHYQGVETHALSESLWRTQSRVKAPADTTIIRLHDDAIHAALVMQFGSGVDASEMYIKMRQIACARGELVAEYNQSKQRYPNTLGLAEWYKVIASVDPTKEAVLMEGYYVEDYVSELQKQTLTLPHNTPSFMKVYMAITATANTLSESIDDAKSQLFHKVANRGSDTLKESYQTWCAQFEPEIYLARICDKLPEYTHQTVSDIFHAKLIEYQEQHPERSVVNHSTNAMYDAIREIDERLSNDYATNSVTLYGRIPTSLDVHCFDQIRADVDLNAAEMSVVSWYDGDKCPRDNEEIAIND